MKIYVINGANLNFLGTRERDVYGTEDFGVWLKEYREEFPDIEIVYRRSNIEGEIVDFLQKAYKDGADGIVLNAGGYAHTSVVIRDAIASISTIVIDIHISNIFSREDFRHNDILAGVCKGMICGLGKDSYRFAIMEIISLVETKTKEE